MLIKLLSALLALSLSGCYSSPPKQTVIVVEKSHYLENINHQRLSLESNARPIKVVNKKTKIKKNEQQSRTDTHKKITKSASKWRTPVSAKISKTFSKKHPGLTFNTHLGQDIRAIRDGKVIHIGDKMSSQGVIIIIRHPLGFYSTYTQNQSLAVSVGDEVTKNQLISTTNGKPFYFEMKKFKQTINPLKYLQ